MKDSDVRTVAVFFKVCAAESNSQELERLRAMDVRSNCVCLCTCYEVGGGS